MAHLFEQQPRESNKAFAAFSLYLSLGPERSMAAVAKKLMKSEGLIARWAVKFAWQERVAAHGTHLAVVEREATEALTRAKAAGWVQREEDHREEEWAMRSELIEAGRKVLEKFKDGSRGATLGDVARALDVASKLGRLATGLGTDGERRKGDELPSVRVEVSVALEKIYGQPLPEEVAAPPATIAKGHSAPAPIVDVEEVTHRTEATDGTDGKHLTLNPSPQSGEGKLL